uniref:Integrase zinc-binding domain-containing protein n=1 Tax=Trichobilharzia regenti TaxID=157069 RepID=A0AA85JPS3_TRIRE|nr:unnamed protein product [Trichobilharzia regenti]
MSAIYYIRNESARYACFVANRVSQIQELTTVEQWRYVPSGKNPADLASRGVTDMNVVKNKWWKGPEFLLRADSMWPSREDEPPINECALEFKTSVSLTSTQERHSGLNPLFKYSSSWYKLLKAVAWLTRHVTYLKVMHLAGYENMNVGPLRVEDIRNAELAIFRDAQWEAWGEITKEDSPDFADFKARLDRLSPIVSEEVAGDRGRLQMLESSYETRRPALLPCYHPVTDLIIRHYHVLEGHLGTSQVLSSIRCGLWIMNGGTAVRKIIDKCMECKLRNARPAQQMMAPLPAWQVSEGNYPFEYFGADLFGTFVVKRGRTLCKRYGCLFTCLKIQLYIMRWFIR